MAQASPGILDPRRRPRLAAAALALAGGLAVFLIATLVFPYHSANHDEAVYLQAAAMVLEGKLFLRPPVERAFRPWFFVEAGDRLYPKYAPVPAAMFAAGKLAGSYRLALSAVGAAVIWLVYAVTAEAFDDRTGLLAAALALASPLFLVETSVFLPYAPTAVWNLLFALAYLRADRLARDGGRDENGTPLRWAAVAGTAVGVAFFARPYTAVLFAAPFVAHALWTLRGDGPLGLDRAALARQGTTAALGLAGVGVALGYNAAVTGSPWLFPYQAFAPLDGLGFGRRAILGYERTYTPALALRANAEVLAVLLTGWTAAGPLGAVLAGVGLAGLRRRERRDPRRLVLAGVVVSVVAGNVYFWGNLNILGALSDPGDGLIALLGPYYHYDLLLPLSAFGARGLVVVAGGSREQFRRRFSPARARRVGVAALVVSAAVFGTAAAGVAARPLAANAAVTAEYERAYAPFEDRELDGAVVFLPTPYGDWLNHPFQALRNDPGYDGEVVYALRENQFAVVDAYPDRTLYRYTYRGAWAPTAGRSVEPRLQRIRAVRGRQVTLRATLGVPGGAEAVSVRLAGAEATYFVAEGPPDALSMRLAVANGTARLSSESLRPLDDSSVTAPADGPVVVEVFVDFGAGRGFAYRIELPVARDGGDTRALTPYVEVCRLPHTCGGEAAYVPGASRPGVFVRTWLAAGSGTAADPSPISRDAPAVPPPPSPDATANRTPPGSVATTASAPAGSGATEPPSSVPIPRVEMGTPKFRSA